MTSFTEAAASSHPVPSGLIGYTEFRTNLPGGRHANVATMRACVVQADGAGRRILCEELVSEPNSWTQFAGWSPDGSMAIIGRGWESPENAAWEEEHKTFRMTEGWLYDTYLLDLVSGRATNITAIDRVSNYNSGLFFWPGDSEHLGFTALIGADSHPFRMDRDGRHKQDLTKGSREFTYGFSASPNGRQIAYHKNYQIYIASRDGSNPLHIRTGQSFNFVPQWSPDGQWLVFLCGEHYNCHPYVVRSDGTGLRKLGDRHGYKGVVEFLDVPDFHGGSSDVPVWSPDGLSIVYASKVGDCVELVRVNLQGIEERLTRSESGTLNYHPQFSRDGRWLFFGSNCSGTRQLYLADADARAVRPITDVKPGNGAMWPHWQPVEQPVPQQ